MGSEFQGPPAVNFYSMLSGLGDTIQANRQAQAKRDAITGAIGPDGKLDFGRAMLGLSAAGDTQGAYVMSAAQNHQDMLKQQAIESARNASNDTFNHGIASANLGISRAAESRAAADFENTPDQYAPNPNAAQPGQPKFIDQYAQATAAAGAGKPIPFETLSGTKFLVRQPDGSYSRVDPATVGQPQQPPQAQPIGAVAPVPSSARVVGDAEGVASGLYDPPNAAGQRPPLQVADAQPANFAGRFQGQPAFQPGAPQPAAQPADLNAVDPQTGRREDWLKAQDPQVQAYIKKIADYEVDPRTTSIKGGHREQVMSAVAQYDPTYDQNNFSSRAKAIKDFATGPQGNTVRTFDVAMDHLDLLKQYTKALDSGDIRVLNDLRNKWLTETGSPLPTNFRAIAPIVGAEVSKAVIGSNNALADREELRAPLKDANAPGQILGAIEGYQGLMGGQLRGLKKQYEDTTGKKDFNNRIRESTRNILLGGGGSSSGAASPSGPVTIDGYTIRAH